MDAFELLGNRDVSEPDDMPMPCNVEARKSTLQGLINEWQSKADLLEHKKSYTHNNSKKLVKLRKDTLNAKRNVSRYKKELKELEEAGEEAAELVKKKRQEYLSYDLMYYHKKRKFSVYDAQRFFI